MVSKVAVTAVVLIVAIPILMGYALAFHERTEEGWESTQQTNVTDDLLNSRTPYYISSTTPTNNTNLLYDFLGAGKIISPEFVNVSETASSVPTYTQTTATTANTSTYGSTTITGALTPSGATYINGSVVNIETMGAVTFTTATSSTLTYNEGTVTGTSFGPFVFNGTTFIWGDKTIDRDTWRIDSPGANTYTVTKNEAAEFSSVASIRFTTAYPVMIVIIDRSTLAETYYASTANPTIYDQNNYTVTVNGNTIAYNSVLDKVYPMDTVNHGTLTYTLEGDMPYSASFTTSDYSASAMSTNNVGRVYTSPNGTPHLPSDVGGNDVGSYYITNAYTTSGACPGYITPVGGSTTNFDCSELEIYRTGTDQWVMISYIYDPPGSPVRARQVTTYNYDPGLYFAYLDGSRAIQYQAYGFVSVMPADHGYSATSFYGYLDYRHTIKMERTNDVPIYAYIPEKMSSDPSYHLFQYNNGTVTLDGNVIGTNVSKVSMTPNAEDVAIGGKKITGFYAGVVSDYTTSFNYGSWNPTSQSATHRTVSYGNQIPAVDPADPYGQLWLSLDAAAPITLHYDGGVYNQNTNQLGPFVQTGPTEWMWGNMKVNPGNFSLDYPDGRTLTLTTLTYSDLPENVNYTININRPNIAFRITHLDESVEYYAIQGTPDNNYSLSIVSTTAYIGSHVVTDVQEVQIAQTAYMGDITYTYLTPSGMFADVSYGWRMANEIGGTQYWINGSVNESVRMLIHLENGEHAYLTPYNESTAASQISLSRINNNIYLGTNTSGRNLGNYDDVQVIIYGDKAEVSGIADWPNLATPPQRYNTLTIQYTDIVPAFTRIELSADASVEFRVDEASVLGGYFPSIKDNTLDIANKWPDRSYGVQLTSAGVYGDTIQFAGNTYTVIDGSIYVNGTKCQLLKTVFSSTKDPTTGEWRNAINNQPVGDINTPASITFGGEWSATVAAYTMESTERTVREWQPGEFAFNGVDSDFALIGLIGCAAVFIALGMYGARSGAKVGTLMLVCGGAALIFLMML